MIRTESDLYNIKAKARGITAVAIYSHRIERKPCEKCGNPKTVAHHENYFEPLNITWLCYSCHLKRHHEIRTKKSVIYKPYVMERYSFQNGMNQIPVGVYKEVKKRIMNILKVKTLSSWYRYLNGQVIPKVSEYRTIEGIFLEYGIFENIWGTVRKY